MLQKKYIEDTLKTLVQTYRIVVTVTFLGYEIATYTIIMITLSNYDLNFWANYYYIAMFCVLFLTVLCTWTNFYKEHFF